MRDKKERENTSGQFDHERPEQDLDMNAVQRAIKIIYPGAIIGGLVMGGLVVWFLSWLFR